MSTRRDSRSLFFAFEGAPEVRSAADLVEDAAQLFVEEQAGGRAVLIPPASAPLGLSDRPRRERQGHRSARSLAQSSSSRTPRPAASSASDSSSAASSSARSASSISRSEERRVGKEGRCRWAP